MRSLFDILKKKNSTKRNSFAAVQVDTNMPLPVKGVDYDILIKFKEVFGNLEVGESFAIDKKYSYAVRKVAMDCYPEYKISVRNTGQKDRVYRKG